MPTTDRSFAAKTKGELCRRPPSRGCCAAAELYGALLMANTFTPSSLRLTSENERFRDRLLDLMRRAIGVEAETRRLTSGKILITAEGQLAEKIFCAFGYEPKAGALHLNNALVEDDCCREAFFRGAFLAGGSVSDPERGYHLELSTRHFNLSREMTTLLLDMEFEPKTTLRKSNYLIYFKESESVAAFLAKIGAPTAALAIHEAVVEKEIRNDVNRRVNCDTANISRTVSAARRQLDAIQKLKESGELDKLSPELKRAAQLRLEYPEESLSALAETGGVSRSGLNHRLNRLCELAGL